MKNKQYTFIYDEYEASVIFLVTDKLTKEMAKEALGFFIWEYDKENNPIDELLKKYAIQAIEAASAENLNEYGVKYWFERNEGFLALDGSMGIELKMIDGYTFEEDRLKYEITES